MNEIIEQTGVGIESIEFSIADNLDHLNDSIGSYRERLKFMDCRGLTLHGPFMNIDPAAFDSEVRKITMMRFHQTYTAGMELGAKTLMSTIFRAGLRELRSFSENFWKSIKSWKL